MGVIDLVFDGVYLGYTMEEADLEFIEDVKDIFFAQLGTQPSDKVPTGQAWQVSAKIGQTTLARLQKLVRGITVNGHSAKLGPDLYRSGYENFAKRLVCRRCDSDGVASNDPTQRSTFYKAFPMVSGSVGGPMGPDTQRGTEVNFYCFNDRGRKAFGFIGRASSVGL